MSAIPSKLTTPMGVVADPVEQKIHKEQQRAKKEEQVKEIFKKPAEDRTVGDYLTIGSKVADDMLMNPHVLHASSSPKLNYLA